MFSRYFKNNFLIFIEIIFSICFKKIKFLPAKFSSDKCILPPHSWMMPFVSGCGMPVLMLLLFSYRNFSRLLSFRSVLIWISIWMISSSCVPFFRSSSPDSVWQLCRNCWKRFVKTNRYYLSLQVTRQTFYKDKN